MENQGKRNEQLILSNKIVFYSSIIILILITYLYFTK